MKTITTTPQNHYINKYGKTLHQLTWFSLPPAEDPLNIMKNEPMVKETRIEEKPKEKLPTFIPNEIMSNILSYLPKPVLQPQEYGIMNNKENDGYFMIIKSITKSGKFVVYDRFKLYENGHTILRCDENKRSKLRKDKDARHYYIINCGEKFIVDNKLPIIKRCGISLTETIFMTTPQYKNLLRENYYYNENHDWYNNYWFLRKTALSQ